MAADIVIERVRSVDDDVVASLNRLLPQLSAVAPAVTAQALGEVLDVPGTALLVARIDGDVVGSVTLVVHRIPSGAHAWVEDVVVDAAARGGGVGEALVRAALAEAEVLGARTVDLTSSPSREAAIRLYEKLGFRRRETSVFRLTAAGEPEPLDPGPFFHGTKADLRRGDLLAPGRSSNFGQGSVANFVYLTATLDAAIWGAELAVGDGPGRIYRVEPTGPFENDPNLTDTKFPGNPTRSYRTREALRVLEEVEHWEGHPPEVLQAMRDHIARLKEQGVEAIND